eukprot:CAMPEP_0197612932 /NCGR_PEP_ID=MMETSP1326-20131121/58233_1 /TAXON_ID=1155430 /ORGANISM="Genus nov. species nov., Strain RCC2288" /LENGTH=53 /DNA_ID=CAMNT_0043181745 /DNA_START=195 /DNA_END=353 /DNA_ORIENTATION=-
MASEKNDARSNNNNNPQGSSTGFVSQGGLSDCLCLCCCGVEPVRRMSKSDTPG